MVDVAAFHRFCVRKIELVEWTYPQRRQTIVADQPNTSGAELQRGPGAREIRVMSEGQWHGLIRHIDGMQVEPELCVAKRDALLRTKRPRPA
jgi:hypothetical protein